MLHRKRSKWSLGVLLLVALGLLVGLASMATATAKKPGPVVGNQPGYPAGHAGPYMGKPGSQSLTAAPKVADADVIADRSEAFVPNDECSQAIDITATVSRAYDGSMPLWIVPHRLDSTLVPRPYDLRLATDNFSTDTPTCGYQPPWDPDVHYQSVWYTFRPTADGYLYLTTYDPMFTRGGIFDDTLDSARSNYDTMITVFSTASGHDCGTFISTDWATGIHNGQSDTGDVAGLPTYYDNPLTIGPYPLPYGSSRERGANDTFWPGVNMVDHPGDIYSSAVCVEVAADTTYKIMVQSYFAGGPIDRRDLVLDGCFLLGQADTTALNAQKLAIGLASNGRIFDRDLGPLWRANFDSDPLPGNVINDFAYDPFNAVYFWYDDPAYTDDGDSGNVWGGNRQADHFWVDKNFTADHGVDPLLDFADTNAPFAAIGPGFASRIAQSQMHNWYIEGLQEAAAGATTGYRMNRFYVGTRAVANDPLNTGTIYGYGFTFDDYSNGLDFDIQSSASQNYCNLINPYPNGGFGEYNYLSWVYGPVATAAVKAPVSTWLWDRAMSWNQSLKPTWNVGGAANSGEFVVHVVNDSVGGLASPSIKYLYDEDDVAIACTHGPDNPGDTGPTYGYGVYLQDVAPNGPGLAVQTILAACVGLDDTVNGYDCLLGTHTVANAGRLVPATNLSPSPLVRQSAVIYFIDELGNLWAVRDLGYPGDPGPNGMPTLYENAAYTVMIPAGAGATAWDLRNAEYMTYNATTGEILISLHATGGGLTQPATNGSMILSVKDTVATPIGYLGVYIHDPASITGTNVVKLVYNHLDADPAAVPYLHDYVFNFDATTGVGSNGAPETFPADPFGFNPYSFDVYRPTFNAGLALGPSDPSIVNTGNVADTKHIFAIAGREDYNSDLQSPVQKGGADPNYWMTHILDFYNVYTPWHDPNEAQLNTWYQELPYTDWCEGYFHGVTGLEMYHDNSRPDVWFNSTGVIVPNPPTACTSMRTCDTMNSICGATTVSLNWNSWDFVGGGVVGYDGYLMVFTGAGSIYDPANWTARTIFADAEVAGADHAHVGAAHIAQTFDYVLPCDLNGEAFIRIVAYDREGNTSFVETPAFRLGVNSTVQAPALNPWNLAGQVIHRLEPGQKHRVIPVSWTYNPDPCIVGGVVNNASPTECGRIEFDITFDGGYSWQCMHMLDGTGAELMAQCINPNVGQVGTSTLHTYDLVIPDYYVDRYPYGNQVSIAMFWRQSGCNPLCPNVGRIPVTSSAFFSIADELGPAVAVTNAAVTKALGESLVINWTPKAGLWAPIGQSCVGGVTIPGTIVKAWFTTDPYDNWATSSFDIILRKADGTLYTVASGLTGYQHTYNWQIPINFAGGAGAYTIRVVGHDAYGNLSYYDAQFGSDIQNNEFKSIESGVVTLQDSQAPVVGNLVVLPNPVKSGFPAQITFVAEDNIGVGDRMLAITGPNGYTYSATGTSDAFTWTAPIDPGFYTVVVTAEDGVGNVSAPAAATVEVSAIYRQTPSNPDAPTTNGSQAE